MRNVLGVIIAFIGMSTVVLAASVAPWFAFGLDAVLQPGRFDSTVPFNIYAVLVGILGALFAGWLCATIARSRIAVISLAVLCVRRGNDQRLCADEQATARPSRVWTDGRRRDR